nr:RNA-directed DNA polymerase, eukaryota [Tanacetum cinerariifolium]
MPRPREEYEDDVEDEEHIDAIDEYDDEDYGTGRGSRSKRQRSDFIDDAAEEEEEEDDDEEEEESENGFIADERDEQEDVEDATRMHRRPRLITREDEQEDVEALEREIQKRFARNRSEYDDDDYEDDDQTEVEQQALLPSVRDPKLWMVKCAVCLEFFSLFISNAAELLEKAVATVELPESAAAYTELLMTSIVKEARSLKGMGINVLDLIRLKLGNGDSSSFWEDKCRFFNGQDHKSRKASWVKWDNVLTLRDNGGLGVASLYALNRGLMFKWIWRFYSQKPSLWTRVIKAIHGDDGKLDKDVIVGGKTCWTSIVKEARSLKGTSINVVDLIRLKLGNGDSFSFWADKWYFWSLESEWDYSVASIRKLIDEKHFQELGISTRWVKSVPSKVNITAWKIKTNALPTRFNLSRREMDIDTLMCPVCKGGVETTSHLFFQCVLSKQIMRKVSSWWNVDSTDVSSYEEWRVWLVSIQIPNKLKSIMEGVFYGLWCLYGISKISYCSTTRLPKRS